MARRVIAVVCGGDSGEREVSLRSAKGIYNEFDRERWDPYIIEIYGRDWTAHVGEQRVAVDKNDFSFPVGSQRVRPCFAFIIIHGRPGEDGRLQGYLDMMGIPYSTSGVLQEALTFNKFVLNQYLRGWGVSIAESLLLRRSTMSAVSDEEIVQKLGLPVFVKPNQDGSSLGVTKVKSLEALRPAIARAMESGDEVIIESFLEGTEVTCGCYKTQWGEHLLPVTEVVPKVEFFDYDAKYNGAVEEITPARIANELTLRVQRLTGAIYDILGCRGIIRVDYILTGPEEAKKINLLEINTVPGMTATSFIPQQLKAAGLELREVLSELISDKIGADESEE